MSSNVAKRTLQSLARQSRVACECNGLASSSRAASIRPFSTSPSRKDTEYETEGEDKPRWSQTPKRMTAPYRVRLHDDTKPWTCNSDPAKLDRFYKNFLGQGGENVLTEEVKWLAVTHKSFEQGARGFNDRLAFFGRRILNMQTNLVLLNSTTALKQRRSVKAIDGREVFKHPALDGLENLTDMPIAEILTKARLAKLASQLDMAEIMRWRPRNPDRLEASGIDVVFATTVYAIIGAIGLQRGSAVAAQVARERVLKPMGIA